jgi:sulfite exporter TauE/SafE
MELWTAFLLGLVGSLHCAGMCGPLALALPVAGNSRAAFVLGRLAYNGGRVATYAVLGGLFGMVGQTAALAGLQRWVSLTAGVLILVGLFASTKLALTAPVTRSVAALKSGLGTLLRRRSLGALLLLGLLNGLLPCGLVYVACAGAAASGAVVRGVEHMLVFGAGTVPLMLGMSLAGHLVHGAIRLKFQRVIPVAVGLVAILLILRGLSLDIPYLSPDLSAGGASCCH